MNWYAHIDVLDDESGVYAVRVTLPDNSKQLFAFGHKSNRRGNRLRAEVEKIAAEKFSELD
jgi:hypothetical protein